MFKEHAYFVLFVDDLFTSHMNTHLIEAINYYKQIFMSHSHCQKPPTKSTNMFFKDLVDIGTRWYRPYFVLLGLKKQ